VIPRELREYKTPKWVGYDGGKFFTRGGRPAFCCEPETWLTYDEARGLETPGVAFALAQDDPFVVLTLTKAFNHETSTFHGKVRELIDELGSFTVFGDGRDVLRIVLRGRLPVGTAGLRRKDGRVEVCDRFRFIPLGDDRLDFFPRDIRENPDVLGRVWRKNFPGTPQVPFEEDLTDELLIERATTANGQWFWWAFARGQNRPGQANHQTILAVLGVLAYWTRRDVHRMSCLFDGSPLAKLAQWARPTYREQALRRALSGGVNPEQPEAATGEDLGAVDVALRLASELKGRTVKDFWQEFNLARRLKTPGRDPLECRAAVNAYCEEMGHDPTDFWLGFLVSWGKVKHGGEDGVFRQAVEKARTQPVEVKDSPAPQYTLAVSLVTHLGEMIPDRTFHLAGSKLGQVVGGSQKTGSNLIRLMVMNGVLERVDDSWAFNGQPKAKRYRLKGAPEV
jgi:hypothetical protein